MASKHQYLENLISKRDQAANEAPDERDCLIFNNKRNWLPMGTMHCAFPIVKVEACGLRLCNAQFSLGNGLGKTAHCAVSVAREAG